MDSHNTDPFVLYSRSLHHYTLGLWNESRRLAEERASAKAKQMVTAEGKKPSSDGRTPEDARGLDSNARAYRPYPASS